jgi:structural maintenance of chromosome 1
MNLTRLCFYSTPRLTHSRQTQGAYDASQKRIKELSKTINDAEDAIFDEFCRKIVVVNIREYEERQLKVATEESAARLQFENQIARLTHACVSLSELFFPLLSY